MCRPYASARVHVVGTQDAVAAGHGNLNVVDRVSGHQLSADMFGSYTCDHESQG